MGGGGGVVVVVSFAGMAPSSFTVNQPVTGKNSRYFVPLDRNIFYIIGKATIEHRTVFI